MYVAAMITSIAIGMTMLASIVRVVDVYPDAPEVTLRQVVAPPEVVVVIATVEPTQEPNRPYPEPPLEPSPVLMALVRSTPTPIAAALTVATAAPAPIPRAVPPSSLAGRVQAIYDALARSSWPAYLWDKVVDIARCESTYNPGEVGDSGRALGLLQIRSDWHPDIVADYNVLTIDGALAGAWLVYTRAGNSFAPWSCA